MPRGPHLAAPQHTRSPKGQHPWTLGAAVPRRACRGRPTRRGCWMLRTCWWVHPYIERCARAAALGTAYVHLGVCACCRGALCMQTGLGRLGRTAHKERSGRSAHKQHVGRAAHKERFGHTAHTERFGRAAHKERFGHKGPALGATGIPALDTPTLAHNTGLMNTGHAGHKNAVKQILGTPTLAREHWAR